MLWKSHWYLQALAPTSQNHQVVWARSLLCCCLWKSPWSQAPSGNMTWVRPKKKYSPKYRYSTMTCELGLDNSKKNGFPLLWQTWQPWITLWLHSIDKHYIDSCYLTLSKPDKVYVLGIWRWFALETSLSMENHAFMEMNTWVSDIHIQGFHPACIPLSLPLSAQSLQRWRDSKTTAILLPTESEYRTFSASTLVGFSLPFPSLALAHL